MGEILRQFNQGSQSFWFPDISSGEMGKLRFLITGTQNQHADAFYMDQLSGIANPQLPWTNGVVERQFMRLITICRSVYPVKLFCFVDDEEMIFSYSLEQCRGGGAAAASTLGIYGQGHECGCRVHPLYAVSKDRRLT